MAHQNKWPESSPPGVVVVLTNYKCATGEVKWKWWHRDTYSLWDGGFLSQQEAADAAMKRVPKEYPKGTEFNFTFQINTELHEGEA